MHVGVGAGGGGNSPCGEGTQAEAEFKVYYLKRASAPLCVKWLV